jgi:anaerobic selenocysteine-containing dehydrogenase
MLEKRLSKIRASDPKKFALFTGRDQMQALTGLFARQFGTPNYAAHGGFCSVNMAAGMIYTIGGSFWEFGGPDLDRARLFVMIGTAEDHHSNPLKIALGAFKRRGGRLIAVNPVRTGYSAIADEWVPIRPGTDGALLLALCSEIVAQGLYDRDFVARYTNGGHLVVCEPGAANEGLLARTPGAPESDTDWPPVQLWWDRHSNRAVATHTEGADPSLFGEYRLEDGTQVKPSFQLLADRLRRYTPEWAEGITGIPAATIRRLAHEMGVVARDQKIELPIAWTDCWGAEHQTVTGNPVAFHAMRGLAAHSNGFHTVRTLAILMSLLGTIDRPGGFRHRAPFPRAIPPAAKTPTGPEAIRPDTPLPGLALGWPAAPEHLFVDAEGKPVRIDKGFSWEFPLSVHGLMHNVIQNAWRGDPYRLDTLMIFMANMAWNSTMNTGEVRRMLNDRDEGGEYKIPFLVVCDAFQSEMTAFADLVLPDTTYLERHDVMSLLDRPISEFDGPVDAVRVPVLPPTGECKPFQEVLIELAGRLKFPAFTGADGSRKYRDYPDFILRYETEPGSGIGFLSGWRGRGGEKSMRGEPNPRQWEMYAANNCVFHHRLPPSYQYMRNWNRGYMEWAQRVRIRRYGDPVIIHLYSEVLQRFRLAAQGRRAGRQPPEALRMRVATYFDPLPFYYAPLEALAAPASKFPLAAITQRPMAMYHAWDSQNAWLRQIHAHNYLFVNPEAARAAGIGDDDWIWVESQWGKVRCMARLSEAVEPGTVWTWNAIGKAPGAWRLAADANEAQLGFLLNHLITEDFSDPVTGQAGWYDLRVRIYRAAEDEPRESWPRFEAVPAAPGTGIPA